MLEQAKAADRAGFDALATSDHFAPWFADGEAANAWVHLGALGQVTEKPIGTAVTRSCTTITPASWRRRSCRWRTSIPAGSSSAWAPARPQRDAARPRLAALRGAARRLETGLEAITRLWDGETVTMDAGWFELDGARLWTRAPPRPRLYVSAFGPESAQVAGRFGDGLWTLGDPERAPEIIEAYREACTEHGREAGEIIFQAGFAWAEDEQAAIDGARRWKPTRCPSSTSRTSPTSTTCSAAPTSR